jgi:hypothetical protein
MKSFINGNSQDKRSISIEIDEHITFYFDNVLRHFKQMQKTNDELGYDEDDDLAEPTYFYWMGIDDWVKDKQHWESHMAQKAWFTNEMKHYINELTK